MTVIKNLNSIERTFEFEYMSVRAQDAELWPLDLD